MTNWNATKTALVEYFGDTLIEDIKSGDTVDWQEQLFDVVYAEGKRKGERRYADATISKFTKRAKQFFDYAVAKDLISINPFKRLKAGGEQNSDNQAFIDCATIQKVIDEAADSQWKMIIALCRFGGLRCPSEVHALKWQDIDWENERFKVTSKKTKRYNKGSRIVPLFPELVPYFRDCFDSSPEGAVYVISKYRGDNLRTEFERIVKRACLKRWPRLFHNLRASRQTELENLFPSHVVCEWLGNTLQVASKHYLQVTEDHFNLAQGGADLVAKNPEVVQIW